METTSTTPSTDNTQTPDQIELRREVARQVATLVGPAIEQSKADIVRRFESYRVEMELARQGDQEFEFDLFNDDSFEESPGSTFSGTVCVGGRWIYNLNTDDTKLYVWVNRADLTAVESAQFAPTVGGFPTNPVNIEIFVKANHDGDIHVDAL